MKAGRVIGAVIVEDGEAKVCQRCLVKWARVRVLDRVFCNTCGNIERAMKASKAAAAARTARAKGER